MSTLAFSELTLSFRTNDEAHQPENFISCCVNGEKILVVLIILIKIIYLPLERQAAAIFLQRPFNSFFLSFLIFNFFHTCRKFLKLVLFDDKTFSIHIVYENKRMKDYSLDQLGLTLTLFSN